MKHKLQNYLLLACIATSVAATQEPTDGSEAENTPPPATSSSAPVQLGVTSVTGSQELPKVLYIVPWKKAELGELKGRPAGSLLDEVLAPVDREVFRRQLEYYEEITAEESGITESNSVE